MGKSIIIIGAGLTGLSAGCYGQMNNYHTSIFEMHDKTGGVCTAWKRKGYTIDGAMHWLVGTQPGKAFHQIWKELGALQGWTIVYQEDFIRIEGAGDKTFIAYADVDRLERHMKELAPEDSALIATFAKCIRTCARVEMPVDKAPELFNLIDGIKMMKALPSLKFIRDLSRISARDFVNRFKNPFLREALVEISGVDAGLPDFPILSTVMTFAWLHQKTAGYPVGGALALSRAIERRYLDLGGDIRCSSRVDKILVEDDKAVGVKLADGTEHRGDIVISAADGHTTIFDMLDGKYINDKIRVRYDQPDLFPPLIYIGLGVARTFEDVASSVAGINFPLDKPITIAGQDKHRMMAQIYNFDPTLAPSGKTLLKVQFNTGYDYWAKLKQDPDRYNAEKERIADQVVAQLDRRFPGLAAKVEMRDVATPVTWVRYTGNWQGSYEGWVPTTKTVMKRMSKTLPGLGNFYMAGQWVEPGGGMPTAAMSGRNTLQIICKKDKKKFVAATP